MRKALALLILAACGDQDAAPFWALDPMTLEPDGAQVTGLQTWQVYTERWGNNLAERYYLCTVLVEVQGEPRAPDCDGCAYAWDVQTSLADSDCADDTTDLDGFTALRAIGLTEAAPDFATRPTYNQTSAGAWADYGEGWVPYGWAYPDAWNDGEPSGTLVWNGDEAFALQPAFAWEL